MAKDPTQVAAKWSNNLSNASQSITAGVNNVTVAPGQAAAAAVNTMRQRLLAAIDSGKWATNVAAVPLATWKQQMLTKGLSNIAQGARSGQTKYQAFAQQFLPFVANVQAQIKQMPNATDQDRENRMLANMRLLKQFKKS